MQIKVVYLVTATSLQVNAVKMCQSPAYWTVAKSIILSMFFKFAIRFVHCRRVSEDTDIFRRFLLKLKYPFFSLVSGFY